jgi:hypothetical protein
MNYSTNVGPVARIMSNIASQMLLLGLEPAILFSLNFASNNGPYDCWSACRNVQSYDEREAEIHLGVSKCFKTANERTW